MLHVCLFCGGGPLTSEHVFAKWLRDRIAGDIAQVKVFDASGSQLWSQGTFDIETKAVCGRCNSGWMSDLEGACADLLGNPMLYGSTMSLDQQQQPIIARWAVKTAMMLEAHRRPADPLAHLPKSHVKMMRGSATPPPGTAIRMFGRSAGDGHFIVTRSAGLLRRPEGEPREGIDDAKSYVSTFVVGFLGFHILGTGYEDAGTPRLGETRWLEEHTTRLWPPAVGVIEWPPARAMTLDDILRLADLDQPVE
jgi:hypothetical protein